MKTSVKWFPIMGGRAIPYALLLPHEKQAMKNHDGQDLDRLAARGGLEASEACAVLEDRPWRPMTREAAHDRLWELVFSAAQEAIMEREAAERALGKAWLKGAASLAEAIERKTRALEQQNLAWTEPHAELLAAARALVHWDWTSLLVDADDNSADVVKQVNALDRAVEKFKAVVL